MLSVVVSTFTWSLSETIKPDLLLHFVSHICAALKNMPCDVSAHTNKVVSIASALLAQLLRLHCYVDSSFLNETSQHSGWLLYR